LITNKRIEVFEAIKRQRGYMRTGWGGFGGMDLSLFLTHWSHKAKVRPKPYKFFLEERYQIKIWKRGFFWASPEADGPEI